MLLLGILNIDEILAATNLIMFITGTVKNQISFRKKYTFNIWLIKGGLAKTNYLYCGLLTSKFVYPLPKTAEEQT